MTNELSTIPQAKNITVTAETPEEMKLANATLVQWCDGKIGDLRIDLIELEAAWKSALAKKWKHTVLKRHAEMAKKRIIFYGKLRTALTKGFYIVPNFPVGLFAIRTTRQSPVRLFSTDKRCSYKPYHQKQQSSQSLPEGDGDYQTPFPSVQYEKESVTVDNKPVVNWHSWADKWSEMEFPIAMAKPHIMEVVERAMGLKIFDEFGVLPEGAAKREHSGGDPMIIARIKDPRSTTYHDKYVSFVIAWLLDTKTL